jgi:hypothetical protein
MKTKTWLCGITTLGNEDNLKELIEPVFDQFDGFLFTINLNCISRYGSADYKSLVDRIRFLGKGKEVITHNIWNGNFAYSRNTYLHNGDIQQGDWFFNLDSEERINPEFMCEFHSKLKKTFEENSVDGCAFEGKFLAFQYDEFMFWRNAIHETLVGAKRVVELSNIEGLKKIPARFNLRSEKRGKFDFVNQALRYYLQDGSFHCLLACENDQELFQKRMELRKIFKLGLRRANIDKRDVDSVIEYICYNNLTSKAKECVRQEKFLNDVYRYYRLGHTDFVQDFDFKNLVKIP